MALFDFAKKKESSAPISGGTVPVSQVLSMKAQGMNNSQIANQLRAAGFSLTQIRDAMAQADIKSAVVPGGAEMEPLNQQPTGGPIPDLPGMDLPEMPQDNFSNADQMEMPPLPDVPDAPVQTQSMQMNAPMQRGNAVPGQLVNELQRVIEEIIEEKWDEVEDKLNALDVWKTRVDGQVTELANRVTLLSTRLDGFSKGMMQKTEEYQGTMEDVGTQMEAVEKLMGKLVPSLAEEIKELRNVVDKLKKK